MKTLKIAEEFTIDPSGRFYTDGEGSGEEFREDLLREKLSGLDDGEKLSIILDEGVNSYGSSFLVEGFAGIVKYGYMKPKEFLDKIQFSYTDPDYAFYKDRIVTYINEAKYKSKIYKKTK